MTITPAMVQYYELKEKYIDSILFFRMWDFYEMFDNDAVIAHKVLWINITSRNKNALNPTPLAWIPYHAKDKYLPILVNAWYKVAIAEQVSDPKLKWIINREVVRIVTPATLNLEWESYSNTENTNYLVWICEDNWEYWISFIESSSSNWSVWVLKNINELSTCIYKISPKEVILEKKLYNNPKIKELLEKKYSLNIFFYEPIPSSRDNLLKHFWTKNLNAFWIEDNKLAIKTASFLLEYLKNNQKSELNHLNKISLEKFSNYLELDEATIKNLDLLYNIWTKSGTIWTLFWILDKTKTSMWKRLLKESIINPLKDKWKIESRLEIIEEFLKDKILLDKIQEKLKWVSDLENILTRLALWRANPRDLLNLKKSLELVIEAIDLIKKDWSKKLVWLLKI